MAAPSNDNVANAILLGSLGVGGTDESGSVEGTNIDATSETDEPANNGKTVWYYWDNNIETHPADTTYHHKTNARMTFGTRRRPGIANQTNFKTSLSVFRVINWPVSAWTDIEQIGTTKTRYAYWEDQSEITFNATSLDRYLIRVDGAELAGLPNGVADEGNFTLWWEQWSPYNPTGCDTCMPSNEDGDCLLTYAPNVTQRSEAPGPSVAAAAGRYVVRYCGGAWDYRLGWVVGKIPTAASATWAVDPPYVSGYFFAAKYRSGGATAYATFPETLPTSAGYPGAGEAFDAMSCARMLLLHDGTGSIELYWTDDQKTDNVPAPFGGPVFSLFKLNPDFTAVSCCGVLNTGAQYLLRCKIRNNTKFEWTGITATLSGTGYTIDDATDTGTVAADGGIWTAQFVITLDDSDNKALEATVTLSDFSGTLQALTFDLTPSIIISASEQTANSRDIYCPSIPARTAIWMHFTGLPFVNLRGNFDLDGDISAVCRAADCTNTNPLRFAANPPPPDNIDGGCNDDLEDWFINLAPTGGGTPSSLTFTINWESDDTITIPPSSITVPCNL